MHLLHKLARVIAHRRAIERFAVWTRNHAGLTFFYKIEICAARPRGRCRPRYLVRFDRNPVAHGGNRIRQNRILGEAQVQELRIRASI